jgi:Family of unknown function (DUF5681)
MSDTDGSDRPSDVGYGKPPKHTQFRKGKSGNPKGRGKGIRNFASEIEEELNTRVPVTENGRRKKITKRKAIAKQLVNKAATGDQKAIPILFNETRQHESAPGADSGSEILCRPEDHLVMASIVKRIREAEIPTSEAPSKPDAAGPNTETPTPETGGTL